MEGDQLLKFATLNNISRPMSQMHEFYLVGRIGPAEDYIEWFDIIRHATENDIVKFYINSEGGVLFTAIQFMRVLTDCKATVIVSVEGACMSGATMIMLCADSYEISRHSMFMFHNYSGGTVGKGGEMYNQIVHEKGWSTTLVREIYEDFLTEEEMNNMLRNDDIYMNGEEVIERLNKRLAKFESEAEQIDAPEEDNEDEIYTQPDMLM